MAVLILHLYAHGVAGGHEGGFGRAIGNGFDHADFGDAAVAEAAFGNGFAWVAIWPLIGHSA